MMDRRKFMAFLVGGALFTPIAAGAQDARIPRIGVLFGSPAASWIEALRQGLRKLGYIEGQTVAIEWRSAEGRYERLPDLAAELVRLPVDVLVAHPTIAGRAAKEATTRIPIVIPASADPVGAGLIASLARPGGNITGSTFISAEISGKRLELLKQVAPDATRVAVLADPANPATALQLKEVQGAARALSVALQVLEVRTPSEFDGAFSALTRNGAGALLVIDDPMLGSHRTRIVNSVAKHRLPAMYGWKDWVAAGCLMSYGANVDEMFRRAATYVDRILKGVKPAHLPVEQPTRFELVLNVRTAKALGLTIPPALLVRADQVIE
jgi:putative ABC transport system substrate-binding protein